MSYHYTDCGLDNVWLCNGFAEINTPYGKATSVHGLEKLHRVIGDVIISLPKHLNGAELRFIRTEMELTQKNLAGIIGSDEQAVRRWEKARNKPMNGSADFLLRALFREYLHGDGSTRCMVDRLNDLDQIETPKLEFRETPNGWVSNVSVG
jgi:putative transcriptional regulator